MIVNYLTAAVVFAIGVLTVLSRRNLIKIVLGLSLMESSSYLLLTSLAYRRRATTPVLTGLPKGATTDRVVHGRTADPVLQNFCLTAIVIGVAITAVFLTVVVRVAQHYRSVDSTHLRFLRG